MLGALSTERRNSLVTSYESERRFLVSGRESLAKILDSSTAVMSAIALYQLNSSGDFRASTAKLRNEDSEREQEIAESLVRTPTDARVELIQALKAFRAEEGGFRGEVMRRVNLMRQKWRENPQQADTPEERLIELIYKGVIRQMGYASRLAHDLISGVERGEIAIRGAPAINVNNREMERLISNMDINDLDAAFGMLREHIKKLLAQLSAK